VLLRIGERDDQRPRRQVRDRAPGAWQPRTLASVARARPCWAWPGAARGARPTELTPAASAGHGPGEIPASRSPLPLFSAPSVEEEALLCLCDWEEGDEKKPTVQLGFGEMVATFDPTHFD
jgi:hypothetical protein